MTSTSPMLRREHSRTDLVRIGSLTCIPVVEDKILTNWLVLLPRTSECAAVTAAARIGGAPVWLLAGAPVPDWVPFEASYRDIGLIALDADGGDTTICYPHKTLPASDRECAVAAAHGWHFPKGEDS